MNIMLKGTNVCNSMVSGTVQHAGRLALRCHSGALSVIVANMGVEMIQGLVRNVEHDG